MKPSHLQKNPDSMPGSAKLFIAATGILGLILTAVAVVQWQSQNLKHFVAYLLLAMAASTLKVRLPGFSGNISPNFLLLLVGVADFRFSEVVVMAFAAILVQSLWKSRLNSKLVRVAFNISAVIASISAAYWIPRYILSALNQHSLLVLMASASCIYFAVNTLLVTMVVSLVEQKSHADQWWQCYLWSFPYYVAGAAVASMVSFSNRSAGWTASLLVLPVMLLVYLYYRMQTTRAVVKETIGAATYAD